MSIHVDRTGVIAPSEEVEQYRREFHEKNCVRLPALFEPRLMALVIDLIAGARWEPMARTGFDSLEVLAPGPAFDLLHFVANWPAFLDLIGRIGGCGRLTWFDGWVYRMQPGAGHRDEWHTDDSDGHLVGLSVNLSPLPYSGGHFQMRRRGSDDVLAEITNTGPGDALIFRISPDLLHRVTALEGTRDKTSFAGWFNAVDPTIADRLHSLASTPVPESRS